MAKNYLTLKEVANIADVPYSFVCREVRSGALPATPVCDSQRNELQVDFDDFIEWIAGKHYQVNEDELYLDDDVAAVMVTPWEAVRNAYDFGYIEPLIQRGKLRKLVY